MGHVARFDRYMLSQLMVLFGFFSFVLVMVYWINRAVRLFDQLIADGQSASVFLEFTALSLPSVIQLALPLAAFAAAIYVTNRMTSESELVVVQATGYSAFRLARPVVYFGLIVMMLMMLLMHFLVPKSLARLDLRQSEIAENVSFRFLTEGRFIEPTDGITLYISEVTASGELRNIFLSDTRDENSQVTYTADSAFLIMTDGTAQLVMINGMAQTLRTQGQRLFTTTFEDFAYNIGSLAPATANAARPASRLGTLELLRASPAIQAETNQSVARLRAVAHNRFSQVLLGMVAALLGFAALLIGGFSRFGVWRQIVFAIFLIIVIKGVETYGLNAARENASLWFMTYLPSALGCVFVVVLLFTTTRPYLFKRRPSMQVSP